MAPTETISTVRGIFCAVSVCLFLPLLVRWLRTHRSLDALTLLESKDPINRSQANKWKFLYWCTPIVAVVLWQIASDLRVLSSATVPSPLETLQAWWQHAIDGSLWHETAASITRIIVGFAFGATIGTSIGLFAGSFLLAKCLIGPITSFMRYVPPTAFVSLLIVYFGVDESYKYAVVFFGVIFFIIQMVFDVVDDLDRHYLEIGKISGLSNWQMFTHIIIPWSLPRVVDVLRINLGAAWTFLVVAELVGSEKGLGHLLAVSQRFNRLADLYACVMTFGIIGLLTDCLIDKASRKVFRWYYIHLAR